MNKYMNINIVIVSILTLFYPIVRFFTNDILLIGKVMFVAIIISIICIILNTAVLYKASKSNIND